MGQILIFPKSIRAFAGRNVVGIKYDLLDRESVSKSNAWVRPPLPRAKPEPTPGTRASNIIPLPAAPASAVPREAEPRREEDAELDEVKRRVRRAMQALSAGNHRVVRKLLNSILQT